MRALLVLLIFSATGAFAQFSSAGQTAIVNAHNSLRSKIAKGTYVAKGTKKPAASNMLKMKWDTALAASAQAYTNTCPRGHSGTVGVGENMCWRWFTTAVRPLDTYGPDVTGAWEQEFQDFGWKSNNLTRALFDTGIGHATQMAWATTGLVGCGVKNCGRDATMRNMTRVVVVCQYKAPGNYLNQNIYTTGATCSACPTGKRCDKATGLCV